MRDTPGQDSWRMTPPEPDKPTVFTLFMVEKDKSHVIVTALNREYAKSKAAHFMGGDPDLYTVTPLTEPGDRIHFDISIYV